MRSHERQADRSVLHRCGRRRAPGVHPLDPEYNTQSQENPQNIVVSPYAKHNYVSHVVYDHTFILAMIERKWNLTAMTYRDANANDLSDFLNLTGDDQESPHLPRATQARPSG